MENGHDFILHHILSFLFRYLEVVDVVHNFGVAVRRSAWVVTAERCMPEWKCKRIGAE